MKSFVVLAVLFSAQSALACSQPPRAWMQEKFELSQLLEDPQLNQRLEELDADRITNINLEGRKYRISTNKTCSVVAQPVYTAPAANGLCPTFAGFQTSVDCPIRD